MALLAVIVEDNATSADIAVRQLESIGFETRVADTAESGMEMIQVTNPDLIVVDERLPDQSGIEMIRALREYLPDLTIIMSTIVDDERTIKSAFAAGCNYYAIKPNGLLRLCKSFTSAEMMLNTSAQELFAQ
jgi:DNA-binding response OmpR family regulator